MMARRVLKEDGYVVDDFVTLNDEKIKRDSDGYPSNASNDMSSSEAETEFMPRTSSKHTKRSIAPVKKNKSSKTKAKATARPNTPEPTPRPAAAEINTPKKPAAVDAFKTGLLTPKSSPKSSPDANQEAKVEVKPAAPGREIKQDEDPKSQQGAADEASDKSEVESEDYEQDSSPSYCASDASFSDGESENDSDRSPKAKIKPNVKAKAKTPAPQIVKAATKNWHQ